MIGITNHKSSVIGPRHRRAGFFLVFAFALTWPIPVRASALESIASWEGDSHQQGFAFLSVGAQLPVGRNLSVPIGVSMNYLYYHYDSTGTRISVQSPGTSLTTGLRFGTSQYSATIMAGGEARWENQDTDAPRAPRRERTTLGIVLQTYEDAALTRRWQASGFGVYVGAAKYLVGRAGVRYQVTNLDYKGRTNFFLGAEGVRQGNELSDAFQAGGFVQWDFLPQRLSWSLHSGYKENWSPGQAHQRGSYFGCGLYRRF